MDIDLNLDVTISLRHAKNFPDKIRAQATITAVSSKTQQQINTDPSFAYSVTFAAIATGLASVMRTVATSNGSTAMEMAADFHKELIRLLNNTQLGAGEYDASRN